MRFVDRILTIVITVTLTSAAWIVFGSYLFEDEGVLSRTRVTAAGDAEADRSGDQGVVAGAVGEVARGSSDASPTMRKTTALSPETAQTSTLVVPVLNVKPGDLLNTFRDERDGGERLHEAIDIMAASGTTVVAAAPGMVEKLYQSNAGGNTIYVRSEDRQTLYYYAHLSKYADGLREGQQIRRGQRLGEVGSSGNADPSAPHLHFALLRTTPDAEWWEPATAINPYPLLSRN